MSEPPPRQIGIVDWALAERIAVALAGEGPSWDGGEEELRAESDRAAKLVRRYTGLKPKGRLPEAELIDRDEWARVNIESFHAHVQPGRGDARGADELLRIVRAASRAR